MTGGGFGGCTVNLVDAGAAEGFREIVARGYKLRTGIVRNIYLLARGGSGDGAEVLARVFFATPG